MDYIVIAALSIVLPGVFIYMGRKNNMLINNKILYVLIYAAVAGINCLTILYLDYLLRFVILYDIILMLLALLSLWDIKEMKIPSFMVYVLALFCTVLMIFNPYCRIINNIVTGGLFSLLLLIAYKLTKKKIGIGDVKVLCALSFAFGYPVVFNIIFIGMFISVIYGILLIVFKKANVKTEIPFIPFLFAGYVLNVINF